MTQQIVGDAHLCFAAVTFVALGLFEALAVFAFGISWFVKGRPC